METRIDPIKMEEEPQIFGKLKDDLALVDNPDMIHQLEIKGFGEQEKTKFYLKPFESLYLLYNNKLTLKKGKKQIEFDSMLEICNKADDQILTKFLIYRDLRSRGYVVKDGFGFGYDFRVYDRGHFGQKGAKYLVFGFNEGQKEKIGAFQKKIEEITQMGKEPIIAVVERRGEVIYYKVNKMNFLENKARISESLEI